jgi:hypothetical protein
MLRCKDRSLMLRREERSLIARTKTRDFGFHRPKITLNYSTSVLIHKGFM